MTWEITGKIGVNDTQACPDRVVAFIRRLHPVKTAEHVSADIGVAADTIRKWIEGVAKPSFVAFSKLILAYGPAFLIAVYPQAPKWLDEAARRERLAALEEQQARIRAEIEALT